MNYVNVYLLAECNTASFTAVQDLNPIKASIINREIQIWSYFLKKVLLQNPL